jgi:hypothetical protein
MTVPCPICMKELAHWGEVKSHLVVLHSIDKLVECLLCYCEWCYYKNKEPLNLCFDDDLVEIRKERERKGLTVL